MRALRNTILVALVTLFGFTSCVESSEKYKSLQSQLAAKTTDYDSLKKDNAQLQTSYDEVLVIIAKLEESFAKIREEEKSLQIDLNENGGANIKTMNREIIQKINLIQDLLRKNRTHISNLQGQLRKMGKENSVLAESILSYEKQLKDKVDMITTLHQTIEEKNLSIQGLNYSLDTLNRISEELKNSIAEQTEKIHTVYYIIADQKDLKENKIIKSNINKRLLAQDFNEEAFTKGDLRKIHKLNMEGKRSKILSTHPESSYTIETDEAGNRILNIKDETEFWSISKYLVIRKS